MQIMQLLKKMGNPNIHEKKTNNSQLDTEFKSSRLFIFIKLTYNFKIMGRIHTLMVKKYNKVVTTDQK